MSPMLRNHQHGQLCHLRPLLQYPLRQRASRWTRCNLPHPQQQHRLQNVHVLVRTSMVIHTRISRWDCPEHEVRHFFDSFADKWLSKKFNEARTRNKQPNWIANNVWASLLEYWGTNEFKKKSTQNKTNRLANPAIANTIYRGGSSSMGEHNRKLEAQLGRPSQRMEVFTACYKKKDDGSWSGSRAEEVVCDTFRGGTTLDRGGGRKRGRVFGMGSEALTSNATRIWTKDHRASTSSVASPPKPPVSTQLQEIKLMLGILFDKMRIQMLRPDQAPATDAPAEESTQEAADP
ncbi:UNVERIFIED_CONTAM: hypothetical protein Sradi_1555400 [Sesamum radiatum]|uniref:Transposase n=1 Tax=Sesamum radiatum TaxID=300843 RepID=A0AAW2UAY4_SESRA